MAAIRGQDGQKCSIGREGCSPKISAGRQSCWRAEVHLSYNRSRLDWPTPHAMQATQKKVLARWVEQNPSQPAGAVRDDFLAAGDVPQLQLLAGGISQECSVAGECDRTVTALRDLDCLMKGAHD